MKKHVVPAKAARFAAVLLLSAGMFLVLTTSESLAQVRPALVKDVENPAHAPYIGSGSGHMDYPVSALLVSVGTVIPSGKRLVIEHVAITCVCDADDEITYATINIVKAPVSDHSNFYVPITTRLQGIGPDGKARWVASESLRLYSDGTDYGLATYIYRKKISSSMHCDAFVSGYTVDVP